MSRWFDAGPLEAIPDPGARGFEHEGQAFFVVRKDGEVRAYRNGCPHTGAPWNGSRTSSSTWTTALSSAPFTGPCFGCVTASACAAPASTSLCRPCRSRCARDECRWSWPRTER